MNFQAPIPRRQLCRQRRNLPTALVLRQVLGLAQQVSHPQANAAQAAAPGLRRIEEQQARMAADLALLRVRAEGKAGRDAALRAMAAALGLGGATWAAATSVSLILAGVRPAPACAAPAAAALAGVQLSARQVHRVLAAGVEAEAADKSRAVCQFWAPRDDGDLHNELEVEDGRE